jgi:hypothetical protein
MLIIIVDKTLIKKKPFITSNIPNFIEKLLIILAKIKLLIHFFIIKIIIFVILS